MCVFTIALGGRGVWCVVEASTIRTDGHIWQQSMAARWMIGSRGFGQWHGHSCTCTYQGWMDRRSVSSLEAFMRVRWQPESTGRVREAPSTCNSCSTRHKRWFVSYGMRDEELLYWFVISNLLNQRTKTLSSSDDGMELKLSWNSCCHSYELIEIPSPPACHA